MSRCHALLVVTLAVVGASCSERKDRLIVSNDFRGPVVVIYANGAVPTPGDLVPADGVVVRNEESPKVFAPSVFRENGKEAPVLLLRASVRWCPKTTRKLGGYAFHIADQNADASISEIRRVQDDAVQRVCRQLERHKN